MRPRFASLKTVMRDTASNSASSVAVRAWSMRSIWSG